MILKYRTSPLQSPPHSSWSYIDNISHITPFYNPMASTLTIHLTLRNAPSYPFSFPFFSIPSIPSIPITLVLNDLAFLLTDEGKLLDKLFDPTTKSHYPTYSNEDISINQSENAQNYRKPYRPHKQYKPHSNYKPYYKNKSHNSINPTNHSGIQEEHQNDSATEEE